MEGDSRPLALVSATERLDELAARCGAAICLVIIVAAAAWVLF